MEKLHYKTLEAAVKKYGPLYYEGQEPEAVKGEIMKDEKGFTAEQADLILDAITSEEDEPVKGADEQPPKPPANPSQAPGKAESAKKAHRHIVVRTFRDKSDWRKQYSEGDDVSHFDKERLDHLIKIGHVTKK